MASGLVVAAAVVLGRVDSRKVTGAGNGGHGGHVHRRVLMAGMQGFKLSCPHSPTSSPDEGAAAVAHFLGGASFAPFIGALVLRAIGFILIGIAAAKGGIVSWPMGLLVSDGAALAFQLPAGPDALGWLLVAIGVSVIGSRRTSTVAA